MQRCCPLLLIGVLLAALGPATRAGAEEPSSASPLAAAMALNERGNQAMLDMRYVDALALYQQSKALAPEQVGVDYSLARAHQMLGEFPEALRALETFQERASPDQAAAVGQLSRLFVELRARVSTLHLRTNQPGARVLVADRVVGVTPLPDDTRLNAGAVRLQIELDGFFPEVRELVLPAQGTLELEVELKPRSTSALILVRSQPEHAAIFVDGVPIGTSSPQAEWVVSAGPHRVSAERDGYDAASIPVQLEAGSSRELAVTLSPTRPVYKRWWFWTTTSAVLLGAAGLTVALLVERPAGHGSLRPGQVSAPLSVEF